MPLLSNFPADPEHAYLGKTVRVVGVIKDFRGTPEMAIHDAADIQIVGEGATAVALPAASAAPAAASSAAPAPSADDDGALHRQIETLNERLRTMDERLRALEAGPAAGDSGGSRE